jgi:Tfp pilus assembly protein PilF
MNKNAIRTVILLGALLAVAQVQAEASSVALQDLPESIALFKKGLEQKKAGDLKAAAESFKKAVALDPDFTDAHSLLADVYMGLERY